MNQSVTVKILRTFLLVSFLLLNACGDWIDYSPIDMYSAGVTYDDANAPRHLSVAAVSLHPDYANKSANLDSMSAISLGF